MLALLVLLTCLVPAFAQETVAPPPDGKWEAVLERVIPAVVEIRVTGTRDFDTEDARDTVGTGFVVDAERGLILTNRHMVHSGPVVAEAVFQDHEEVELRAIYRDPVHDFGLYRFDPKAVKYQEVVALPLAPEAARVGIDIRIVGNDAGEKISILTGTLARLDREAPDYGGDTYNDFDTFYYQAASGTSGGSSGSPVLDVEGRVVALNAGGRRDAASSYYLPLDRVVRALAFVQRGEAVPRGTIQVVLQHRPFDEVRRLGLSAASEALVRETFPDATGMLVVDEVLPKGPGGSQLEPGDVVLKIAGQPVRTFIPWETVLDESVGKPITVEVERGGKPVVATLTVQDLHAITPDEYLEVGRAVLHELSFQQARNHAIEVKGIYVAVAGYMLGRAGVPEGALLVAVDGTPVPTLDALEAVFSKHAHGDRVQIRFVTLDEPSRDQVVVTTMDRQWFPMQRCRRDDATGLWPCTVSPDAPANGGHAPHETLPLYSDDALGKKLAPSLVMVEFDVPHPTAGVKDFHYVGNGVIVDAVRGRVLVDRDTVPVALGDIDIVFAGSLRVPGKLLWLHPVHDVALIGYDPALLGDTPVQAVSFSDKPLEPGDKVVQIGLDPSYRVVAEHTTVERVEPILLGAASTPRYRDYNVEGVRLESSGAALGGVIVDKKGVVRALWASFVDQAQDDRRFYGLPSAFLPAGMKGGDALGSYCATGAELRPLPLADAEDRGLTVGRTKALVAADPIRRSVLEVVRVMGGSLADLGGLRPGDLLLDVDVEGQERVITSFSQMEALNGDLCGDATATWTVLRDGVEVSVPFDVTMLDGNGTDRAVTWAGMVVHAPHIEVATQEGTADDGVYVAWMWFGTPGARYGLRPTRRIVEVDGVPTPDLDAFLAAVRGMRDRQAVRLKMVALDGRAQVYTLKLDLNYWPLTLLERGADGTWTRTVLAPETP